MNRKIDVDNDLRRQCLLEASTTGVKKINHRNGADHIDEHN